MDAMFIETFQFHYNVIPFIFQATILYKLVFVLLLRDDQQVVDDLFLSYLIEKKVVGACF